MLPGGASFASSYWCQYAAGPGSTHPVPTRPVAAGSAAPPAGAVPPPRVPSGQPPGVGVYSPQGIPAHPMAMQQHGYGAPGMMMGGSYPPPHPMMGGGYGMMMGGYSGYPPQQYPPQHYSYPHHALHPPPHGAPSQQTGSGPPGQRVSDATHCILHLLVSAFGCHTW